MFWARYTTYLLETWMDFFWSYSRGIILNEMVDVEIIFTCLFLFPCKAVSTSLTESTLNNVPRVVNVRELKTGALTPTVSAVIG